MNIYKNILNELDSGKKVVMVTVTGSHEKSYFTEDNLDPGLKENMQQALRTGELQILDNKEGKLTILEPFFPQPRMIILGGGHIAKPLTEFASKVGFSVIVVDDRPSFANKRRFLDADFVLCESFSKCFDMLNFNAYTYVIVVTRGHRHDLSCLRKIVQKQWAYAGMIGSRRRVKSIKEQLLNEGYSQDILNKVNAPIGLEIGAITPEEIALSILVQAISFRRLKDPSQGRESPKISWIEFDKDVIEELSSGKGEKKAIATIISAKGSVPRRAGAKMLIWRDGRIMGSIGGGCSEGLVIRAALNVIDNGGYKIQEVDMTGSVAEDEGMVCGGMMQVLVESCY